MRPRVDVAHHGIIKQKLKIMTALIAAWTRLIVCRTNKVAQRRRSSATGSKKTKNRFDHHG
jgi:hypothetical protein